MDSVEKRVSEKLGFRIEDGVIHYSDGDIIAANSDEQALYADLLASERRREWVKVTALIPVAIYETILRELRSRIERERKAK